jgi:RNA polymerase sigma-70 factor (ECF subfamily)
LNKKSGKKAGVLCALYCKSNLICQQFSKYPYLLPYLFVLIYEVASMSPKSVNQDDIPIKTKKEMFSQIYIKYRQSIFNYIYYRVGEQDLADDLTSDVFVRMVDKYDAKSNGDKPIAPWLYTIARNLIIDHQRRNGIVKWQPLSDQIQSSEKNNPEKQTDTRLTQECLITALNYLTDDQRQVILLKFIERRTNREIGNILGKPEGAVKSLQYRALSALQRALEKEPCYDN